MEGTVALTNRKKFEQFEKEISELSGTVRIRNLKPEDEIERLLGEKFYNPYDVLQLDSNATDEEIRKQYLALSVLIHPDKFKDSRAKDAFQIVQQAHKTLIDQEKRKVYLRIMKEARQKYRLEQRRTEFERDRESKKRIKSGQSALPPETFETQYKETCRKIFEEIEGKKNQVIKLQQSNYSRKMDELETRRMVEQYRILTEDEWERSRDKRVSNWRDFSKRKFVIGTKRSDGGIRPPPVETEVRPDYVPVDQKKKNL